MDPITLAIVTALIAAGGSFAGKAFEEAGKAVGSKLGGAVGDKAAQLLTKLGKKAEEKNDPIAQAALSKVAGDPQNERAQKQLSLVVEELVEDDSALQSELAALAAEIIKELKPIDSSGNVVTVGNITGNTGSNINVSGGDINIGQPPRRDDR